MDNYLVLKYLHIMCATILTGTGVGIAFFMFMASRTQNFLVIAAIARIVILADWMFTAPAVVGQLVTGLLLMKRLQYSFSAPWFLSAISLFVFIGCCWIPVVFIQYRLKSYAEQSLTDVSFSSEFRRHMKYWIVLGIPAFIGVAIMFWLMIFKPLAII